ncbi:LexA family protein [Methylobacterium oryzisoli]|uniref:LexA family protein n=1 Tax=Methylobacterium oryzisoli TaxID=3385502 RepID=UPI003891F7AE
MDNWRERLRQALEQKGLTMKSASLGAGLNQAAVQQIVSEGKDPRASTLTKLAEAHDLSLDAIMLGEGQARIEMQRSAVLSFPTRARDRSPQAVRLAPVAGTVGAGIWFELDTPPQVESEPVPYVPCRFPELEQTAYKVVGPSMNKRRIHDGDFVIAVPYWDARVALQDNDIVVVQRHDDGGKVEWTVKEVSVKRDEIHLIPRSTDPAHQEPVVIPRSYQPDDYRKVEIVGLVVGKFSPL